MSWMNTEGQRCPECFASFGVGRGFKPLLEVLSYQDTCAGNNWRAIMGCPRCGAEYAVYAIKHQIKAGKQS